VLTTPERKNVSRCEIFTQVRVRLRGIFLTRRETARFSSEILLHAVSVGSNVAFCVYGHEHFGYVKATTFFDQINYHKI